MEKRIYIFGAHSRGQTLGVYLTALDPDIRIEAYLVDNDEENHEAIDGVPVLRLGDGPKLTRGLPVYLGTRGVYHERVAAMLEGLGMGEVIPVTPELDRELRGRYLELSCRQRGRSFDRLEGFSRACIYVVRSASDKPLREGQGLKLYEREIQAGAALADGSFSPGILTDDTGFHISGQNRQFCELTATYWIWKNAREDILGLEHYRRRFLCGDGWAEKMERSRIDVVLPTPLYVGPSIAQNYRNRHVAADWDFMMGYLKRLYPEDYRAAEEFFEHTNLYSPCNMFIMRRGILDSLCAWMFPILFACAEHGGEREDSYQNRYPGFLAERLMSFYFERHREEYRVVYADKSFLG